MKLHKELDNFNKHGFSINLDAYNLFGGLNENIVNTLSIKNTEPDFIVNFRNKALNKLKTLRQPDWSYFEVPDISYDDISYYAEPVKLEDNTTQKKLQDTFSKIGLQIQDKNTVTKTVMEIIFDSVSITNETNIFLIKEGIIFLPLFQAIKKFPNLVQKYLGTVVPIEDNFFAALNSAVFSEGSFCYIPKNTKCLFDLSTYFRTNSENFAQFERTLIVVEENSSITYVEGCSAPIFTESPLHVAIVEIIVKKQGSVKYTTVQNWYRGNQLGEGGLYNFTTKRGICMQSAKLDWVQVEMGSAITWKYPSTILVGNKSKSDFYSISLLSGTQIADTGGKVFHIGKHTCSRLVSKSVSLNSSTNIYRGLVEIAPQAYFSKNHTECDSLVIGKEALTTTLPYSIVNNYTAIIQQEASISKIEENLLFFLLQRGIPLKSAISILIFGFCSDICSKLPLDFGVEVPMLISLRTEETIENI